MLCLSLSPCFPPAEESLFLHKGAGAGFFHLDEPGSSRDNRGPEESSYRISRIYERNVLTTITSSKPTRRTHRPHGRLLFGTFAARRGAKNSPAAREPRRQPLAQATGSSATRAPQALQVPDPAHTLQGASPARRSPARRSPVSRILRRVMTGEAGMATAEYAIATLAAVGLAGLLVVLLRSDEVRGFLLNLIRTALSLP